MSGTLLLILTLVFLLAGFRAFRRVRRVVDDSSPVVGDDLLGSILDEDQLQALDDEEPLDEDAIRRAEDEFWEEDAWAREDWDE